MSQTAVAPAVPAKKARLDAVDGVRGLMALMIVLNHWSTGNAWGRFGWTGLYNLLEIFFMISGFFIALSALKPSRGILRWWSITSPNAPIACGCIICFRYSWCLR